jgi:16S rRNA G1207 methylase RsmC
MNPPFVNAQDVAHILHARTMLRPGGRMAAICADGPRQQTTLRPLVEACGGIWEELPAGTFEGTNVRAVLLTLTADPS